MSQVHELFSKAFAQVGAIGKEQRNSFHNYAYRGIDDVMNALHGVLADVGLFYVPKLVDKSYDQWETNKGARQQVATLDYEFVFYAPDGTSLTVGPVTGQAADTDDKAPMKALSQAAKYALLQAFCIPTQDTDDPDGQSPVSQGGGRAAAGQGGASPESRPATGGPGCAGCGESLSGVSGVRRVDGANYHPDCAPQEEADDVPF